MYQKHLIKKFKIIRVKTNSVLVSTSNHSKTMCSDIKLHGQNIATYIVATVSS